MEFFATYDVMTGVRIAATLGGFFGLMVFLVVYKSRGESQETIKALKVKIRYPILRNKMFVKMLLNQIKLKYIKRTLCNFKVKHILKLNSNRQDPKIAAVAAAVMQEEEDRELQEAMDATGMSIYPDDYDHIGYRRGRLMSVGNISAPPVFNRGYRFSSIGKDYTLFACDERISLITVNVLCSLRRWLQQSSSSLSCSASIFVQRKRW